MRPVIYGAVLLVAVTAPIASWHVPEAGLELRKFRKVSDAEFAVMREEAVGLARGGSVRDARYPGERYFEVSCYGVPGMLVNNPLEQLAIVLYPSREFDVPCVVPMLSHRSKQIVPTPDGLLVKSGKLVRSSADRIMTRRHSTEHARGGIAVKTTDSRAMLRGREAGESS
jgi:hypothetical protein